MKAIFTITLVSIICITINGQSRSNVIQNKVLSQTTYDIDYEDSNGKKVIEQYEKFDIRGNLIEIIQYDSKGKIKDHEKYEYNSDNKKVKEYKLDTNGKVYKTMEYKYKNGLKTERITYDPSNKMVKVKKYEYQFYNVSE
ncbi:MAG: hypothetical protein JW894_04050 [Bacteroidales bacterium]|nr:hypothetical protein [Bacteroidales bacterium]